MEDSLSLISSWISKKRHEADKDDGLNIFFLGKGITRFLRSSWITLYFSQFSLELFLSKIVSDKHHVYSMLEDRIQSNLEHKESFCFRLFFLLLFERVLLLLVCFFMPLHFLVDCVWDVSTAVWDSLLFSCMKFKRGKTLERKDPLQLMLWSDSWDNLLRGH